MPIETICQGCARKLRVADEHAGKKARCPQCGMIYIVPGEVSTSEPRSSEPPPDTRQPTSSERWRLRTPDGRTYGPVPKKEMDQWYAEGRIARQAALLQEGTEQWLAAPEVYPALASRRATLSEEQNPFGEVPRATTTVHTYRQSHRGGVILALAVLGWLFCPVFAPFAWAMGSSDLRAMRSGRMDPNGMSLTQAGMILGMIQSILLLALFGLMCVGVLA